MNKIVLTVFVTTLWLGSCKKPAKAPRIAQVGAGSEVSSIKIPDVDGLKAAYKDKGISSGIIYIFSEDEIKNFKGKGKSLVYPPLKDCTSLSFKEATILSLVDSGVGYCTIPINTQVLNTAIKAMKFRRSENLSFALQTFADDISKVVAQTDLATQGGACGYTLVSNDTPVEAGDRVRIKVAVCDPVTGENPALIAPATVPNEVSGEINLVNGSTANSSGSAVTQPPVATAAATAVATTEGHTGTSVGTKTDSIPDGKEVICKSKEAPPKFPLVYHTLFDTIAKGYCYNKDSSVREIKGVKGKISRPLDCDFPFCVENRKNFVKLTIKTVFDCIDVLSNSPAKITSNTIYLNGNDWDCK